MPDCVDIVGAAYRDAVELGVTENRAPASFLARKMPRVAALADDVSAKFQGRVQGGVGDINERAGMLESALGQSIEKEVDRLTLAANRQLYGSLGKKGFIKDIEYVGPKDFADAANGQYRDLVFGSTPREYWRGVPDGAYDEIDKLRRIAEERKVVAEQLGYPSAASRDSYLRQEWEEVDEALQLFSDPKQGGLISPSKQRAIPVHAVGINAGLTPTSKTVGELMNDSIALWNRAIAEAWERKLVLGRYGAKAKPGAIVKGRTSFKHPLYQGWSADREIVNAVEGLHKPPGQITRGALDISATFKNTVFGPLDLAITGVQGLKALGTGGVQLFANQIVRSLSLLRLAPAKHFREALESGKLPLLTKMANGGLHLGLGPSAVTPGKGTVIRYIPLVGKRLDKPISDFIDAKTRVEFGMVLNWLRVQLAEGNLLMLHMAGRDINDPKVWKTGMDWANTMTGASRGAQTPGRRALETASLTSFQMTRSEMATLGGIAKAAASGTPDERILATMTLASFGAMVYGLGSALNMAFGNGPVEFDPRKGDWATIQVGGQNVPIIPQRGLIRAISKSVVALEDMNTEKVAQIWAQYALSKQGPGITGPVANLAGFGFDPDVGFRTGDLPAKFRFINVLPLPPLVSSLVLEEDSRNATSAGFQFAGFNPFPVSPIENLRTHVQEVRGEDIADNSVVKLIGQELANQGDEEARQLLGRLTDRERSSERGQFTVQRAQELQLPELAQQIAGGDDAMKRGFAQRYRDLRGDRALVSQLELAGVQFPEPQTKAGRLVDEYFEVYNERFERYVDPDSGLIDEAKLDRARDRVLDQLVRLDPGVARALRSRPILGVLGDENVSRVERELLGASVLRNEYAEIVPILDRWNGKPMARSEYEKLEEFWDQADLITGVMRLAREREGLTPQELAKRAGITASSAQAILNAPINVELTPSEVREWLVDQQGLGGDVRLFALNMSSSSARSEPGIANPKRDAFLQQHREVLEAWFPSLYGITFERRQAELVSR